ncbi:sulfatase-like hydrolase/transferase [Pontiella sulfatireligans]|uniref:Arylsulfatase n=1 Tax=Pontiella sulfatireligans TaxID=2750658 RepID=A0A6C2UDR0_9BACT|nr:sulfatase-like hydrolase/transferase [Pontiella sulfatireligans]SPS74147.1 sulfatase S1_24 [Kiritimatiellales bacterium]VGO18300.1 Arylsulfatase [Pontiella sulfatireligans]
MWFKENRKRVLIGLMACLLAGGLQAADRPNVVIIMLDDLGAETLGCYGNTGYSTPNIDRLAAGGARFENAYGTPSCSPSRAMILSGLYTNRSGIKERLGTGTSNCLPAHLPTFADLLKNHGYRTGIAGKWHLGDFDFYPDHPAAHGFDDYRMFAKHYEFFAYNSYVNPGIWENGEVTVYKGAYGPDMYCDFIVDFIERNKEQPFLAYLPMTLVHKPFHKPKLLDGKIKHFLLDDAPAVDQTFGLMLSYADHLVGRILDKLDELNLSDNTLVIFTGDNGTPHAITSHLGDLRVAGGKLSLIESGYRVPYIARWPGKIPVGQREAFFTHADLLPSLAGLTGAPMTFDVSGMDLSHNFFNTQGVDREYVYLAWEGGQYMVRDKRFRLHEDGRFYDIPITSTAERYSEKSCSIDEYPEAYQRLREELEKNKTIQQIDDSYSIIPFGEHKKVRKENLKKSGIQGGRGPRK